MKPVNRLTQILLGLFSFTAVQAASGLESEPARLRPVATTYLLEGVVEAELRTTISAQTSGVVRQIRFDVNDLVSKDEVVVVIDGYQQSASLQQARSAEKEASIQLQEVQSEFNRMQEVFRKNVVSRAEFDKASAALKSARARMESSQAATRKAQEQLDYTQVRAPFSGIVTGRLVEPGEAVNIGSALVSGVSLERLRVITHVPQSLYRAVKDHRRALVITEDSEIVTSQMTFFPYADPLSHSFQLRIDLPGSEANLLPGMFVKVAMEVGRQDKIVIPFNAVAFRGEVTGVYLAEGERLHFRHIRLGRRLTDNEVVVVAGVSVGERVVTDPVAAAIEIKRAQAH